MPRKTPETTSTYMFFNINPKNRLTGDCAIRALSAATGATWEATLTALTTLGISMAMVPTERKVIVEYLRKDGWIKHPQPRTESGKKLTGAAFVAQLVAKAKYDPVIASIGAHHITCISGGRILDTWDCSDRCIGNYWTKEVK